MANGNLAIRDSHHPAARRHAALTLIEVMVLMNVLAIVAVGVGVGLQSAVRIPERADRAAAVSTELCSELDNWRAVAWGGSPWPASLPYTVTDTVTLSIGGRSMVYSRTTSIQNWDPNNIPANTSPQADFVQVQITIDSRSSAAYLTKPW